MWIFLGFMLLFIYFSVMLHERDESIRYWRNKALENQRDT